MIVGANEGGARGARNDAFPPGRNKYIGLCLFTPRRIKCREQSGGILMSAFAPPKRDHPPMTFSLILLFSGDIY